MAPAPAPFLLSPPLSPAVLGHPWGEREGVPSKRMSGLLWLSGPGLPKDPECGATALPRPRPSLCLPRRTAGSAPPRGGLGPSEGAQRVEARSRWWPRPGDPGSVEAELELWSQSQRGGGRS